MDNQLLGILVGGAFVIMLGAFGSYMAIRQQEREAREGDNTPKQLALSEL